MPGAADVDGKSAALAGRFLPVLVPSVAAALLLTLVRSFAVSCHNHNQQMLVS